MMYKYIKRLLDILFSLMLLLIFLIPMIIIAILIKIEDHGPALFKQIRTGYKGKNFTLYKFRSMNINNDVYNFKEKDKHTKIGKLIRSTSLDELPQLINILKGDMSFIGPRPWIPEYYNSMNIVQKNRCEVKPGLTGLAQAKGRNNISIFEKINFDLEYVKNYSLKEDIKVILLTVITVLSGSGADAGKSTIQNELDLLKTQEIPVSEILENI